MWEEVGSSVLEQRVWEQMMPMEEKVESSLPGTEDGGATCCVHGQERSLVLLVWKRGNGWGPVFLEQRIWRPCRVCAELCETVFLE